MCGQDMNYYILTIKLSMITIILSIEGRFSQDSERSALVITGAGGSINCVHMRKVTKNDTVVIIIRTK